MRIRNAFLQRPLPDRLRAVFARAIGPWLSRGAIAVRSSAPEEDSAARSFAGLHESHVNVTSLTDALDRVRLVWSSFWSDAALMYRKQLKLSVETSSMAVLIQEVAAGRSSGVAFAELTDLFRSIRARGGGGAGRRRDAEGSGMTGIHGSDIGSPTGSRQL